MNNLNIFCFILNVIVIIICGVIFAITPMVTRKQYLFGVKIPSEAVTNPKVKAMKKSYVALCLAGMAVVLTIIAAQYMFKPDLSLVMTLYYPFMIIAIQFTVFIAKWRLALKLKKESGWKVNDSVFAETKSSHSRGKLSDMPWGWYIFCFIIIIATVILTLAKYPGLPDRIPTHYDINMQPDAWADKSLWAVMLLPVTNLFMLMMMWVVGFMYIRAKLQIDPQKPALSFAQHRVYRRRMGHSIGFLALGLVILFALLGFMSVFEGFTLSFAAIIAIPIVASIPIIIVPIYSGQGGCKIKLDADEMQNNVTPENMSVSPAQGLKSGDDKHWKLGTFYYNPDDPAHIVEDRFGFNIGWNYSRLWIKITAAVLIIGIVALYVWVTPLLLGI
ncbi:MAG: DUF1648 domain-containing protein [Oscillospiraceae bacterium]|nr:DUF1648 domain-containing protein [Oscillospiraceae bacterium]